MGTLLRLPLSFGSSGMRREDFLTEPSVAQAGAQRTQRVLRRAVKMLGNQFYQLGFVAGRVERITSKAALHSQWYRRDLSQNSARGLSQSLTE